MNSAASSGDERFLVLAPTGRDGPLTCALLARQGLLAAVCDDIDSLCKRLDDEGAAGIVIAQEALAGSGALARLTSSLARQESWSDLPILLFSASVTTHVPVRAPSSSTLSALGNVTVIERPVHHVTIISAVRSALRVRRRQYLARDELQGQQRAVQQRDQFLAMLGHELRNPLSAIALANSLEDTEHAAHRHRVIGRQVQHLIRLVDDLLDVARVTSGKIVLKHELVELGAVVESSASDLQSLFAAQQVSLQIIKPSEPVYIQGDRVRLGQVIGNLLTNAVKYTPQRGHIELQLARSGDEVVLQVRDSGIGIAPEMLDRVFDLFSQAESALDRAKGGLGIGLTLVRNMVELHGGRVEAQSAGLNRGSCFEVRLPAATPPAAQSGDVAQTTGSASAAQPSYQVLVVEDNADSRELLAMILEQLGHQAHMAEDGPSGVSKAISMQPDILLVDIGLPGLDGYGVARNVRDALGPQVYIVALTGYGQPEDRKRALAAGFDAHYTKPLDMQAIERVLLQRERSLAVAHAP